MSHFVLRGWPINMAIDNSWALTSLGREWGLDAFQEHVDSLSQSWRCEDLMPNSRAFSLPLTATSILSSRIVSCHSGRTASEPDGWAEPPLSMGFRFHSWAGVASDLELLLPPPEPPFSPPSPAPQLPFGNSFCLLPV